MLETEVNLIELIKLQSWTTQNLVVWAFDKS
jgi:hypothetical protein